MEFIEESVFLGVVVTIAIYNLGVMLKSKLKLAIFNPLLITIIGVILLLFIFGIDYEVYASGAKYISYLLTPATVALAVPLYKQIELLKKNWFAIIIGLISGAITSMCTVLVLAVLFHLSHAEYVTLLPKSITTAIGMGVSEELGGYVTISVAVIIVTGILGNMIAEWVCRIFRVVDPVAKGIGIGCASHAIGTTKAMELGQTEGAMSGLAIALSGLITVVLAPIFALFY